jgi:hypothetical protein
LWTVGLTRPLSLRREKFPVFCWNRRRMRGTMGPVCPSVADAASVRGWINPFPATIDLQTRHAMTGPRTACHRATCCRLIVILGLLCSGAPLLAQDQPMASEGIEALLQERATHLAAFQEAQGAENSEKALAAAESYAAVQRRILAHHEQDESATAEALEQARLELHQVLEFLVREYNSRDRLDAGRADLPRRSYGEVVVGGAVESIEAVKRVLIKASLFALTQGAPVSIGQAQEISGK